MKRESKLKSMKGNHNYGKEKEQKKANNEETE